MINEGGTAEVKKANLNESARFKKADLRDVLDIAKLEIECFDDPWSEEAIRKDIGENNLAHYFVARADNQIVGYAGVWFISDEGYINNICVSKKYRRKGLGLSLLRKLINEAESQGVYRLTLEVRESNKPAIDLYKKLGFVTVGRRPRYYQNNGEDALIMWREEK